MVAHLAGWRVAPLTPSHAAELVGWAYPEPFHRYSLTEADPAAFTDPANGFVALLDNQNQLVGYRSFGPDGRVPGGNYDDEALDTGGGLRPDLTGRGLGRAAISLGLDYGRAVFAPAAFRVTVWSGNQRALRVVRSLGFTDRAHFAATTDGDDYVILTRTAE